jgi:alkanesulfonate monooxygenase SsuD/methylene tetrahydromethanopterin reductase-like flavin-dependent oxidoreductase (luciferase family)
VSSQQRTGSDRSLPIVLAGTSDAALRRVAAFGDGWYGFNLDAAAVRERVTFLAAECRKAGRDPDEVSVAVSLADGNSVTTAELAGLGVTELVLVAAPPDDPSAAADWVAGLAVAQMRHERKE